MPEFEWVLNDVGFKQVRDETLSVNINIELWFRSMNVVDTDFVKQPKKGKKSFDLSDS